jgi:type IV pilus assembly protein PilF
MGKLSWRRGSWRWLATAAATAWLVLGPAGCAARQKRDPDQSQIRYQLAVGYYRDRRIEPALEELDKALKADPENADAYNMLGIIALGQGHDFQVQLEAANCLKGDDATLVREEALKKFRDSLAHFQKATALKPDLSSAWNNLSVAAMQLHDWELATEAARNALKDVTYSDAEVARANLGWALFHKKDVLNAWKELHEAVGKAPGLCVGRYRLAKVYMERGDVDRAAEEVEAVVGNKQCPIQEAFLLAGLVHERRKERDRGRALFERCTEMAPRSCVAAECRRYAQLLQ